MTTMLIAIKGTMQNVLGNAVATRLQASPFILYHRFNATHLLLISVRTADIKLTILYLTDCVCSMPKPGSATWALQPTTKTDQQAANVEMRADLTSCKKAFFAQNSNGIDE